MNPQPIDQPPAEQEPKNPALPSFIRRPDKTDKILLGLLALLTIYSLALTPARPWLLVNAPWALSLLTGSGMGLLITAAQGLLAPWALAGLTLLAAVSPFKFLLLYFFMGKKWGQEFLDWIFAGRTPFWYRKLEGFIERHIWLCLLIAFIPFSPIPATILLAIAGIRQLSVWSLSAYCYLLLLLNKGFYLYLGFTFGEDIQPLLNTIDRYMTQITFALLAYVLVTSWWRERKKPKP